VAASTQISQGLILLQSLTVGESLAADPLLAFKLQLDQFERPAVATEDKQRFSSPPQLAWLTRGRRRDARFPDM